jgi:hypothetical protein
VNIWGQARCPTPDFVAKASDRFLLLEFYSLYSKKRKGVWGKVFSPRLPAFAKKKFKED